jgi:hypothetical protein
MGHPLKPLDLMVFFVGLKRVLKKSMCRLASALSG